jgi:hypothetical protein
VSFFFAMVFKIVILKLMGAVLLDKIKKSPQSE